MEKPTIELRNIKLTAWASEETNCYQALLYVNGERWGTVSNAGHGGPDDFHGINGRSWDDVRKLNETIAATYPPMNFEGMELTCDLEIICGDIVAKWDAERLFQRSMKSSVLFTKPGVPGLWSVKVKKPHTFASLLSIYKLNHPQYTYLADLPTEKAREIYYSTQGEG